MSQSGKPKEETMTAAAPRLIAADRQHSALQTIFSFFLGLMVLAFVGVGANTFYPSPAEQPRCYRRS